MTIAAAYAATAKTPPGERPNDITVFGCTGNAGRAVAFHVIRAAKASTPPLRVGLAGRNRSKVQDILDGICTELGTTTNETNNVNIIVADLSDESSMLEMCKSSSVVVSCAGPYGRYGEASVKACIDGGAHYVDITGEQPWVSRMESDYNDAAIKAGVTLLPFSGYDCVPAELGMYLAGKALVLNDNNENEIGQINLAFRNKGGGFPRGTLNTILDAVEGVAPKRRDGDIRFYPKAFRSVAKNALSPIGFLSSKWSSHVGQFTGPNFMAGINVPVLCRAAPVFGFSDNIVISDRAVVSGTPSLLNGYGLFASQLYITALVMSGIVLTLPPVRWWLRKSLQTSYSYSGDALGKVVMDAEAVSVNKGATTATARLKVPGDAGIYATGLFAASVADVLYEVTKNSSSSLPPAGFHSPVAALHKCKPGILVESLQKLGADVSVKTISGEEAKVVDATKL